MKKTVACLLSVLLAVSALWAGGCSHAADKPLAILPAAPWRNAQKAEYEIDNGNKAAGTAEIDVQKSADSNVYKITKVRRTGDKKVQSGATIRADTLMPVDSYYDETSPKTNYTVDASYQAKWNVTVSTSHSGKSIHGTLPRAYYDNESLLVILGALTCKKGQTFRLNDAIPLTCKIKTMAGRVERRETVIVPYGRAECDRIDLGNMQFWYSADGNRVLYQYKNGSLTYRLKSLTRAPNG